MLILGTWPVDDLRRAFVEGAKWWEFERTGGTMWASDRDLAEIAAEATYPNGRPAPDDQLLLDIEAGTPRRCGCGRNLDAQGNCPNCDAAAANAHHALTGE